MVEAEQAAFRRGGSHGVSFLRWAGPMLIGWAAVCIVTAAAHGFARPEIKAVGWLSPIYAVLYVARMNAFLSVNSIYKKMLASVCILAIALPAVYVLPHVLPRILIHIGKFAALIAMALPEGWLAASVFGLLILALCSAAYCLLLSIFEVLVTGSTAGWKHFYGLALTGAMAFALELHVGEAAVEFAFALFLLIVLPLPHLFIVWWRWLRRLDVHSSSFTMRRALTWTALAGAAIYIVGIVGYLPSYGWRGFVWPSVVREYEIEPAVVEARRSVLERPQGRGALPIGGRTYLIPGDFVRASWTDWSSVDGAYDRLRLRIPYDRWIEGHDPRELNVSRDLDRLTYAQVEISTSRRESWGNVPVWCIPERIYGLRQCFGVTGVEPSRLMDLGVDPDDLERLGAGWRRGGSVRGAVLAFDDEAISGAQPLTVGDGIGRDTFFARCTSWRPSDGDPGPPSPESRWQGECRLLFDVGEATVTVTIDARLLPHWRVIHTGLHGDFAAWQASAQDAERIDIVADRIAADYAIELTEQPAYVHPLCRLDRILVAAIGAEWKVSRGFPGSSPVCPRFRE